MANLENILKYEKVGRNLPTIRRLREKRGWSQTELARLIGGGITQQQVSNYESGKKFPSYRTVWMMSNLFEIGLRRMTQIAYLAKEKSTK